MRRTAVLLICILQALLVPISASAGPREEALDDPAETLHQLRYVGQSARKGGNQVAIARDHGVDDFIIIGNPQNAATTSLNDEITAMMRRRDAKDQPG